MNYEEALGIVQNLVVSGPDAPIHKGGMNRVVLLGGKDTGYVIHAISKNRPIVLPFNISGHLVRIIHIR